MRITKAQVRAAEAQARELLNMPKNRCCELEYGERWSAADPERLTHDSREWPDDGDLEEIRDLVLLDARAGERLDLYVHGWDARYGEPTLVGNLDAVVQADGSLHLSEQLPEPWGPEENPARETGAGIPRE